jgi:hypothetical protein
MYHTIAMLLILLMPAAGWAQSTPSLDKMPADLETELALSSLPNHLRQGATVYLLDPAKGYYIGKQGSNGFVCLVGRTDWEWADFRKDIFTPIGFNAEGGKTMGIVYRDVAAMRATGKFSARQVRDTVIARFRSRRYVAPAHEGISFMLAPIMRIYTGNPGDNTVKTMSMPHYMFYAPYVSESEIGIDNKSPNGPWLANAGNTVMGAGNGPHGFIVMPAGEAQTATIRNEGKALLQRLAVYSPYLKLEAMPMHH